LLIIFFFDPIFVRSESVFLTEGFDTSDALLFTNNAAAGLYGVHRKMLKKMAMAPVTEARLFLAYVDSARVFSEKRRSVTEGAGRVRTRMEPMATFDAAEE
jgi:hypothetical protein